MKPSTTPGPSAGRAGHPNRSWAALFVALALLAPPAHAQMPEYYLNLNAQPWSPATTPGGALPNDPPGRNPAVGTYEFSLGICGWPIMETEVTLHWPAEWPVLGYEVCAGTLVSGDPAAEGTPLVFQFPDCVGEGDVFLRLRLDCSTPGRFDMGRPSVLTCYGPPSIEPNGLWIDIGDFCGTLPSQQCTGCPNMARLAGWFQPASLSLTVQEGDVATRTIQLSSESGGWCYSWPECGSDYYTSCYGGVHPDVDWISLQLQDPIPAEGPFIAEVRCVIAPTELLPGEYEARIYVEGGGCGCSANCMPVHLTVLRNSSGAGDLVVPPGAPALGSPVPNPSRGTVSYAVTLPSAGRARAIVVDVSGREVARILDRELPAGTTLHTWRASEEPQPRLPDGVYFLRLMTSEGLASRTLILRR